MWLRIGMQIPIVKMRVSHPFRHIRIIRHNMITATVAVITSRAINMLSLNVKALALGEALSRCVKTACKEQPRQNVFPTMYLHLDMFVCP